MPILNLASFHQYDHLRRGSPSERIGACHTLCVLWLKEQRKDSKAGEWLTANAAAARVKTITTSITTGEGIQESDRYVTEKRKTGTKDFNETSGRLQLNATANGGDTHNVM